MKSYAFFDLSPRNSRPPHAGVRFIGKESQFDCSNCVASRQPQKQTDTANPDFIQVLTHSPDEEVNFGSPALKRFWLARHGRKLHATEIRDEVAPETSTSAIGALNLGRLRHPLEALRASLTISIKLLLLKLPVTGA